MNLQAIFIANGTAILLLIVVLSGSRRATRFEMPDMKLFFLMVACNIYQSVVETVTYCIDGVDVPFFRTLAVVLNALLYINNILFAFIWTVYADYKLFEDTERLKKRCPVIAIPAILVIFGSLLNLFTPVFFSVSAENVYSRTSLYILPFVLTYAYLIYGELLIYHCRKKLKKYLVLPSLLFLLPILIGSLLQLFCYGLSLVWLGVSIGLVTLYTSVQDRNYLVDPLSGLYNRQHLERFVSAEAKRLCKGKRLAGIMIDVDSFKDINDRFGHLMGDDAISVIGSILRKSAHGRSLAVRYAGDEFIIVAQVQQEPEINELLDEIIAAFDKFNRSGEKPYRLEFSHGITFFDPENDTMDKFVNRMDQSMYADKREKKRCCVRGEALYQASEQH